MIGTISQGLASTEEILCEISSPLEEGPLLQRAVVGEAAPAPFFLPGLIRGSR